MTRLYRITAPHFCAGVLVDALHCVVDAAPIVRYMVGWTDERMAGYCARRGWQCSARGRP
jgi:hypothetical protein